MEPACIVLFAFCVGLCDENLHAAHLLCANFHCTRQGQLVLSPVRPA